MMLGRQPARGQNEEVMMTRIKLDMPEAFPFSTDIAIRITDINYGGHLGNDAVLSLIHEARLRFLMEHGFSELDIDGFGLIMTDSAIVYQSEAFHGDVLTIEVVVKDFTKYGCDFVYRITNKATGKEVARAKTGVLIYDYESKKVVEVPEGFKEIFSTMGNQRG